MAVSIEIDDCGPMDSFEDVLNLKQVSASDVHQSGGHKCLNRLALL